MTYYIGIDPGKNGAYASIDAEGKFVEVGNFYVENGKVHSETLYWKLHCYGDESIKIITEQVNSRVGNSMPSVFNFGATCGRIWGICELFYNNLIYVSPQKWKKYFGLLKTKEQTIAEGKELCRLKALEIFPEAAEYLKRKKDHDRAEALLIARYAWENKL